MLEPCSFWKQKDKQCPDVDTAHPDCENCVPVPSPYRVLEAKNIELEAKLAKATELLRAIGKACYACDPCPDATILHMINKSGLLTPKSAEEA